MRRRSDPLKPKQSDSNRLATYWLFNENRITLPYSSKQFLQDWSEKQLDIATFLKTYNFGYLEFGRYVQENRRINMFYALVEGCTILSSELFFNSSNLGMDREVSIAYGARGKGGNASAFYQPFYGFINLTRNKGVGSFAHEYAHALDYTLGSRYDTLQGARWLSDGGTKTPLRRTVAAILEEVLRQFNKHAEKPIEFNENVYWYRRKEVFARSFEAWVSWTTKRLQKDGYPYKADLLVSGRYNYHTLYPSEFSGKLDDLFTTFCILAGDAMNGKPLSELKKKSTTKTIKTQSTMIKPAKKTKRTTRKTTTTKCKTTRKTTKRAATKQKATTKKKTTTRKRKSCKR